MEKATTKSSVVGPLQKILDSKNVKKVEVKKVSTTKAPPAYKDPYLEQEEMDLARLSKLLGIDKGLMD